ncbi:ADP-ribosylation/Crystallin J1 [Hypoxylon crocopeplum]|nr:ADP-ribosylation/Crystallin J1 [Hypoxylon crocopeplum]
MSPLPDDYLERVYAGVLGKGWIHQRILEELGHIYYYVHEQCGVPLVVTDDDISGTFTFIRAMEEHGAKSDISPEAIGRTWLNNVINKRTIFFWGGKGIMTEHTAYLNLRKGIPAPRSGSIQLNGKTLAEQIGAQIYVDGWALVAPGNPTLAAKFAEAAGSVSHDGESLNAAKVWASMEAEAFVSKDVNHLLETGLKSIPSTSLIATLIADVRQWSRNDGDWLRTRQRIEDKYGYDKFHGICHVVPNHGILIMALIYAGDNFHEAMHIICTCGWDTDSNAGNLGCLVAIMHSLRAFDGGPDWRGPLADRVLIFSADAGYSFNNAPRIAYDIANMGRNLAGEEILAPPKDGAQYHFSLPGSVQGFQVTPDNGQASLEQAIYNHDTAGLAIRLGLVEGADPLEVTTQTFAPLEVREMPFYDLVGSPLVYPGQVIRALVRADSSNSNSSLVRLMLKTYTSTDDFETLTADPVSLAPGGPQILEWEILTSLGCRPIQSVGLTLSSLQHGLDGTVWLDHLRWDGSPRIKLSASGGGSSDFYKRAFVNGADFFHLFGKFMVAQDMGEGIVSYGTREWTDFRVVFKGATVNLGEPAGVAVRAQGLNRYYSLVLVSSNRIALVKAFDQQRIELATESFEWNLDTPYTITMEVKGGQLRAQVGSVVLVAYDSQYLGVGIGLVVTDGSLSTDSIEVGPLHGII